jgi:hypothetical protein
MRTACRTGSRRAAAAPASPCRRPTASPPSSFCATTPPSPPQVLHGFSVLAQIPHATPVIGATGPSTSEAPTSLASSAVRTGVHAPAHVPGLRALPQAQDRTTPQALSPACRRSRRRGQALGRAADGGAGGLPEDPTEPAIPSRNGGGGAPGFPPAAIRRAPARRQQHGAGPHRHAAQGSGFVRLSRSLWLKAQSFLKRHAAEP